MGILSKIKSSICNYINDWSERRCDQLLDTAVDMYPGQRLRDVISLRYWQRPGIIHIHKRIPYSYHRPFSWNFYMLPITACTGLWYMISHCRPVIESNGSITISTSYLSIVATWLTYIVVSDMTRVWVNRYVLKNKLHKIINNSPQLHLQGYLLLDVTDADTIRLILKHPSFDIIQIHNYMHIAAQQHDFNEQAQLFFSVYLSLPDFDVNKKYTYTHDDQLYTDVTLLHIVSNAGSIQLVKLLLSLPERIIEE